MICAMVGSLMIWKLKHCKRLKRTKEAHHSIDQNNLNAQPTGKIKKELELSDENQVCRVCLKTGDIPIYGNNCLEDIAESLSNFTGIEISPNDEYPKFICHSCYALLKGAIRLKKTAQDSNQLLHQNPKEALDNESLNSAVHSGFDFEEEQIKQKSDSKKFFCNKCVVEFETFADYSNHRLTQEHENSRRTCPICKNSYTSLYFRRHMALHSTPEILFVCDICGKKFTIKALFLRHRATHFNNFPFQCSLCPYKGRFKESLKMHMRFHTGEKPYQCPHCPGRYVSKSNLNKHMCQHKTDFDFKCETCNRGFYTKRKLDMHYTVVHTGIKDHICNTCGKAFGYRKQMMKHQLRVHKREKFQNGRMPLYLQMESKEQQIQDD